MIKHMENGISGKIMRPDSLSFIQNLAEELGIKGVVFEKPDGSIKIIAEGEEEDLEDFIESIKRGKVFSEIDNFYVNWDNNLENFGGFNVIDDKS